ncbi:hypothetical protein GCM10011614_32910 [Novosphingobium colocasiae]|uniref:Lipoprotein n=1 Tax=Novosphingobium colocasiae TaxID=1256513 RepID=A0A918UJY8_9SPHN|nr:hypothetical protein GCM10011614_32910 [Novosphingobium colocasiae]
MAKYRYSLLLILAAYGCSRSLDISNSDEKKVIQLAVQQSVKSFGSSFCIVTKLSENPLKLSEKQFDAGWLQMGNYRYRELGEAKINSVPSDALTGLLSTSTDFGCLNTIRIERPTFFETEKNGNRSLLAAVKLRA